MYYFDHDTRASRDMKIMQLRCKCGGAAVDAYWYLLEVMYEDEQMLCKCNASALQVHCNMLCIGQLEVLQGWIEAMVEVGLFETTDDGKIYSKRAMDTIENYKEQTSKRRSAAQKRWEMQTQSKCNASAMQVHSKCNANKNKNKNKNIKETLSNDNVKKSSRFSPPTTDEVQAYGDEWAANRGLRVSFDAERFCDFYASKGWKVGKDTMKDWKAAARGWIKRHLEEKGGANVSEYDNDF